MSYRGYSGNRNRGVGNIWLVSLLCAIFCLSLVYEVYSDGVTAFLNWLPGLPWANFAGDTIMNVVQIVIFSLVAGAAGGTYSHRKLQRGEFTKESKGPSGRVVYPSGNRNSNGNNTGSGYSGQRYSGNGSNRGNSGAMRSYRGDERW